VKAAFGALALGVLALGAVLLWPSAPGPAEPAHRMPAATLPANGPLRIVTLGTSLTLGGDWRERLAAELSACAARPVEVVPVAEAGEDSDWGAAQMDRVIALQPSLVLIEFSINDADMLDGVTLGTARKNHEAILGALKQAVPVLVTMSPAFGPRGWVRPNLPKYEAQYRALAEEKKIGLIDLAPVWHKALEEGRRRLMPDGLHPTDAAMVQVALPVIRAELGRVIQNCG